jgi:hypothetical protein
MKANSLPLVVSLVVSLVFLQAEIIPLLINSIKKKARRK